MSEIEGIRSGQFDEKIRTMYEKLLAEGSIKPEDLKVVTDQPRPVSNGKATVVASSGADSPTDGSEERRRRKALTALWRRIADHKSASVFLHPVSDETVPEYSRIVKKPMDLSSIKKRIEDGTIATSSDLQRDVYLMLANAVMFNAEAVEVHQIAKRMLSELESEFETFKAAESPVEGRMSTRKRSFDELQDRKDDEFRKSIRRSSVSSPSVGEAVDSSTKDSKSVGKARPRR